MDFCTNVSNFVSNGQKPADLYSVAFLDFIAFIYYRLLVYESSIVACLLHSIIFFTACSNEKSPHTQKWLSKGRKPRANRLSFWLFLPQICLYITRVDLLVYFILILFHRTPVPVAFTNEKKTIYWQFTITKKIRRMFWWHLCFLCITCRCGFSRVEYFSQAFYHLVFGTRVSKPYWIAKHYEFQKAKLDSHLLQTISQSILIRQTYTHRYYT